MFSWHGVFNFSYVIRDNWLTTFLLSHRRRNANGQYTISTLTTSSTLCCHCLHRQQAKAGQRKRTSASVFCLRYSRTSCIYPVSLVWYLFWSNIKIYYLPVRGNQEESEATSGCVQKVQQSNRKISVSCVCLLSLLKNSKCRTKGNCCYWTVHIFNNLTVNKVQ